MRKLNGTLAASALLGLAAGWSASAAAQQVATPKKIERDAPDVTGLQSSQISHLGRLTPHSEVTSSAVALGIAGSRAQDAGLSKRADTPAVDKGFAADAASTDLAGPDLTEPVGVRMGNEISIGAGVPVSFPTRTSQLGSLGTVAKQQRLPASVASAAVWLPKSQVDLGHSLSSAPAIIKTPTQ
jgi:hypothetical protein